MKHRLTILLTIIATTLQAQQRFEATVVDARTHEALPFASVYADKESSTITNVLGTFAINCSPSDTLRISYVGYKTVNIAANRLGSVVMLKPQELLLSEVLVVPIGPMIDKICKETLRLQRKHAKKKAQFFYRQTAYSDSTCYEFAEAFLSGGSAVALHHLKLLTGRYAGLQANSRCAYSYFGNFFTFSQLEVAATYSKPTPMDDVVPLFRHYDKFYDVSYEVAAEEGNRIFVIHFDPKPEAVSRYAILGATLYVDEKTLHLRRIVGRGYNFRVMTKFTYLKDNGAITLPVTVRRTYKTEFSYVIDLSSGNGFPEVQSAFVEAVYKAEGKTVTTRSLLFNLGSEEKVKRTALDDVYYFKVDKTKTPRKKGKDMAFNGVLHNTIEQQGYDPLFWRENEIVRRTPIEQEVMELFEQQNLFGVFQ